MKYNKPSFEAHKLLDDIGYDDVTNISLTTLIDYLDAIYLEEKMDHCDGKIIFGKSKAIIKINEAIEYEGRKRFAIAHEIGHLILHKDMKLPDDTLSTFNIIAGTEKFLQNGQQELEANEFASELLMPSHSFLKEAKGKKFCPDLLKTLAEHFKTSLTATIFRYLQFKELHPICLVMSENGKVKYWKKSEDLKVWVTDINRLPPPEDSVAKEYIDHNYEFLYTNEDKAQKIYKSTWFRLNSYEEDSLFFEYCIPTKKYKTVLSIIWEA